MQEDMSALNLDGIQEVIATMSSFDSTFKDISEKERSTFLAMIIKKTLEKPEYQKEKVQDQPKVESLQKVADPSFAPEVTTIEPQSVSRVYGDKWFVIQNRLLNAITNLDLNERRLIMFLSPEVRKAAEIDPTQRIFTVAVKDFAREYGIKGKYLYEELESIADSILEKVFFFWYDYKGNKAKKGVSWVSECDYIENEGLVKIKLDDTVIEMLTVFDKANPFTKYERKMIVNLGSYGVILFELIVSCMHQQHKQKAYTIDYLRAKFNCVDRYEVLADFKRYVINNAIKDIERHTPYRISYTQNKKGRAIHELVFSFEDTREKALKNGKSKNKGLDCAPNTAYTFINYTDKQLARAVHSKKFMADYNGLVSAQNPANQSSGAWVHHMVEWVKKDPERFTKRPVQEYLDDEQAPRF